MRASPRAASRGVSATAAASRRWRAISGSSRATRDERRRDQARVRREAEQLAGDDARGLAAPEGT